MGVTECKERPHLPNGMRPHPCPHCDFIYIGEQPPDDGCPACGKAWTTGLLAPPPVPAAAGAGEDERPVVRTRRSSTPFLGGLTLGVLATAAVAAIGWSHFVDVERFSAYRDLQRRQVQTEQQLTATIEEVRAASDRAAQSETALAARETELNSLRAELQSLGEQHSTQSATLQAAQMHLAELEKALWSERTRNGQSFVRNWQLLGPFPLTTADGDDALARGPIDVKQPQQGIDGPVRWARHDSENDRIGLAKFFGRHDPVVCYALCWVHTEAAREVNLSIGSDDGVWIWINGEKVHENRATRGASPGQDTAKARLKTGWNEVLAKVDNRGSSEWELILEFRSPEDSRPLKVYSTNLPPDPDS
jgi:hypothetical protein